MPFARFQVSEYLKRPNTAPVLIMSYEMFVRSSEDLERLVFDVVVCDEGHRLKNEKIKGEKNISLLFTS